MADRGPVIRVDRTRPGPIVIPPRSPYPPPLTEDGGGTDPNVATPDNSIVTHPIRRDPKGRTFVVGAVDEIVPIVYGKQQVGGKIPWAQVVGTKLYIMFVIGEGPIEDVSDLGFGDSQEFSFSRLGLVAGTDYNVYLGTDSQTSDTIFSGIDSDWIWKFPGTAYVTMKLDINRENFDQIDVLRLRCTVKGRKVVDWRSFPTMLYADRAYSDNAALCELDFTHERLFGLGATTAEINLPSFGDAADDCDVITAPGLTAPGAAPTTAGVSGGGSVENGTFQHAFTYVDTTGLESLLSPISTAVTLIWGGGGQHVHLTSVTTGPGGTHHRNIYRRKRNPDGVTYGPWRRIYMNPAFIDNTTTAFDDRVLTSHLNGSPPADADVRQFRIAMVVDSNGETCGQTIDTMRQCFASQLVFNNGQFFAFVDKVRAATGFTYDGNNINEIPSVEGKDPAQVPTQVIINITDVQNSFTPRAITYPSAPIFSAGDSLRERNIQSFDLPWIPSYDQGMRIAIWVWKRLNRTLTLRWKTLQAGALPLPGSIVAMSHPRAGIPSTDLIVTSCSPAEDRIYWDLTAEIYDPTDYDLNYYSDDNSVPPTHEPPNPPDPPTNLVLTNVPQTGSGRPFVNVQIAWDNAVMEYETSTLVRYSLDPTFATFTELGPFVTGPVFLYNPTLAVRYYFRLYTVRVSNGQLSVDYLADDIIPSFTDASIPEVTQIAIGPTNWLDFYGPIPQFLLEGPVTDTAPPAPTLAAAAGGSVDDGDHLVCSSRVYPSGESELGATASVTCGGGNNRVNITNLDPSPPADVLFKKVYITKTGPGASFYHASDDAPGGTSDSIIHPDSSYTANDLAPEHLLGLVGFEIFDAFGIATPATDPMPLFAFLPWNHPAQRYKSLDCTKIVHEDPTTHAPRIDVYIRTLTAAGANSTGVLFTKNPATWGQSGPPISIPTTIDVLDGVNDDLDIPVDANFVYLNDPGAGLTADFTIAGITVEGITPTTRKRIVILNTTGFRAAFDHEGTGSTAANRINVPGATGTYDFGLTDGSTTIEYDLDAARWKIIATNNAGFGASGGVGIGYIWSQHNAVQTAGFSIHETGVMGSLSTRCGSISLVDGNNDDVFVSGGGAYGVVRFDDGGLTASPTIRSHYVHGNLAGIHEVWINNTGWAITIKHNYTGGAAPKFFCPGGVDLTWGAGPYSTLTIVYSELDSAWVITGQM